MASCYHCGRGGASYRRNVSTGTSNTVYYGKKRTTYSTRNTSGLRSLCENCAFNIDKGRLIGSIVGLWILNIVLAGLIIHFKF